MLNCSNGDCKTPLFLAVSGEHESIAALLIERQDDRQQQMIKFGTFGPWTVFQYCEVERPEFLPVLERILEKKVKERKEEEEKKGKYFLLLLRRLFDYIIMINEYRLKRL